MADYLVVNGTDAELTNVNAGGVDVPKRSVGNTITLTTAELATLLLVPGVAVLPDAATRKDMRSVARQLKYRKVATL